MLVKYRYLSRSRTAYYLRKAGKENFEVVGSASRRGKERFREAVAAYIADDPDLAKQILRAQADRSRTILMLEAYEPEND